MSLNHLIYRSKLSQLRYLSLIFALTLVWTNGGLATEPAGLPAANVRIPEGVTVVPNPAPGATNLTGVIQIRGVDYPYSLTRSQHSWDFTTLTVSPPNSQRIDIQILGNYASPGSDGLPQSLSVSTMNVRPAAGYQNRDSKNVLGLRVIAGIRGAIPRVLQRAGMMSADGGVMTIQSHQHRIASGQRPDHNSVGTHRIALDPAPRPIAPATAQPAIPAPPVVRPPTAAVPPPPIVQVPATTQPAIPAPPVVRPPTAAVPPPPVVQSPSTAQPAIPVPPVVRPPTAAVPPPPVVQAPSTNQPPPRTQAPAAAPSQDSSVPAILANPAQIIMNPGNGVLLGQLLRSVFTGETVFAGSGSATEIDMSHRDLARNASQTALPWGQARQRRVNVANIFSQASIGRRAETAFSAIQGIADTQSAYTGKVFELLDLFDPKIYEGTRNAATPFMINLIHSTYSESDQQSLLSSWEGERTQMRRRQFDVLGAMGVGEEPHSFLALFNEWKAARSNRRNQTAVDFLEWLKTDKPVVLAHIATQKSLANAFLRQLSEPNAVRAQMLKVRLQEALLAFAHRDSDGYWVMGSTNDVYNTYVAYRNQRTQAQAQVPIDWTVGRQRFEANRSLWTNSTLFSEWNSLRDQIPRSLLRLMEEYVGEGYRPAETAVRALIAEIRRNSGALANLTEQQISALFPRHQRESAAPIGAAVHR